MSFSFPFGINLGAAGGESGCGGDTEGGEWSRLALIQILVSYSSEVAGWGNQDFRKEIKLEK